jgi:D-alanyl-D-alanine dipeptidase
MKNFRISITKTLLLTFFCFIYLSAQMPIEKGTFKKSDLVELMKLDSTFKLDIRYATINNFTKQIVYPSAQAFLQRPAAEALVRVNKKLKKLGLGLLIFDGYRPWQSTKLFWDITPDENKKFVADPAKGSKHNRGCAIDLSLYDLKTGKEIPMPGEYDEMSDRSNPNYTGGSLEQKKMRDLLRKMMEEEKFNVYEFEWWHFDYFDWQSYRIENSAFKEIK